MSDSTPRKIENGSKRKKIAPPIGRHRREHDSLWVTLSLLFHVGLLVVLWFTPVRKLVFQPRDMDEFQVTARAERIEEMVKHLRDREAAIMDDYLEELFEIEEELEDILDTRREQFDELAGEWLEDAPTKALRAQEEAMRSQETALQAEEELAAQQAPSYDEPALNEINEAQADAEDAQREALQALAFTGEHFEPVRQAQASADTAQVEASAARDRSVAGSMELSQAEREDRDKARRAAEEKQRFEREQKRVSEDEQRVARSQTEFEDSHRKVAEKATRLEEAEEAYKAKREAADQALAKQNESPQAKKIALSLKSQTSGAKKSLDIKKRELDRANAEQRDREKRLKTYEERLASTRKKAAEADVRQAAAQQAAAEAKERVTRTQESVRERNRLARDAQSQALARQKEAHEALKQSIAAARAEALESTVPENVRTPELQHSRPVVPDRATIPEIYDEAVTAEERVAETYKHVYATEIAMVRQLPVPGVLKETVVAKTKRPELDREILTKSVRTADGAQAHRAEVNRANQEMEAIVEAAYRFLSKARGDENGMSVSLASFRAAGARNRQLRELAAEDEQVRYKDLSAAMRDDQAASGGAVGKKNTSSSREPPPLERDPKNVVPGRVVVRGGTRPKVMVAGDGKNPTRWVTPKWMYVDAWYTIGPFPNPGRRNIDTQFPPESVIDLDASYVGKDGRRVKWEFLNSSHPGVFPNRDEEYGIYYASAKVWFEEPMDLWVAVGSDDNSRIWLNGDPIWASGRELKSWRADEGGRKVSFKKGINDILYRVENGWRETLYSFMICLDRQ